MTKFSVASFRRSVDRKRKENEKSPQAVEELYPSGVQQTLEFIRDESFEFSIVRFRLCCAIDDPELAFIALIHVKIDLLIRILRRADLLARARHDRDFQQAEIRRCTEDVIYWINNWCWTYDPRVRPATIPFDLFPIQERYLNWRKDRRKRKENGCVEKSRDMGVTWLNLSAQLHCWLFEQGYKGGFGSRVQDLVDRLGDPDSIFEKIRILLKNLPTWMKPKSYQDNFMKLINEDNGSTLIGEGGKNIGRGGRNTQYEADEAGFWEQADRADSALSENCPVIFWTSTINIFDVNNLFDKKIQKGSIPVFRLHWTDDPRKDAAWYKQRCETLDPLIVAAEIDIDRDAAAESATIPAKWIRAAVDRWKPRPYAMVNVIGCDVGRIGDATVIAPRLDKWIGELERHQGRKDQEMDGYTVGQWCVKSLIDTANGRIMIDYVGWGASAYDYLKREYPQILVYGLNAGERSVEGDGKTYKTDRTGIFGFWDRRAEWWWRFREMLDPNNGVGIELPDDPELIKELRTPKFGIIREKQPNSPIQGWIRIESKEEVAKRLKGRSTDRADAVVMAFADIPEDTSDWIRKMGGGR